MKQSMRKISVIFNSVDIIKDMWADYFSHILISGSQTLYRLLRLGKSLGLLNTSSCRGIIS